MEKTNANIRRIARSILGDVPMSIHRHGHQIVLIVDDGLFAKSFLVRDSRIDPNRLAFDRID